MNLIHLKNACIYIYINKLLQIIIFVCVNEVCMIYFIVYISKQRWSLDDWLCHRNFLSDGKHAKGIRLPFSQTRKHPTLYFWNCQTMEGQFSFEDRKIIACIKRLLDILWWTLNSCERINDGLRVLQFM